MLVYFVWFHFVRFISVKDGVFLNLRCQHCHDEWAFHSTRNKRHFLRCRENTEGCDVLSKVTLVFGYSASRLFRFRIAFRYIKQKRYFSSCLMSTCLCKRSSTSSWRRERGDQRTQRHHRRNTAELQVPTLLQPILWTTMTARWRSVRTRHQRSQSNQQMSLHSNAGLQRIHA